MKDISYLAVIFFLALGPLKIIPAFAAMTRDKGPLFQRDIALRATLIALGVVLLVTILSFTTLSQLRISVQAAQLAAGIVLFLFAINIILHSSPSPSSENTPKIMEKPRP